jgi:uncharacterized protein
MRRDGRAVQTPTWFANIDDGYYVFSAANAGKVKRLRHTNAVRIAFCDMRGNVTGEWYETVATLVDDRVLGKEAHRELRSKYGWQMLIANVFSTLSGRLNKRQFIRIDRPQTSAIT